MDLILSGGSVGMTLHFYDSSVKDLAMSINSTCCRIAKGDDVDETKHVEQEVQKDVLPGFLPTRFQIRGDINPGVSVLTYSILLFDLQDRKWSKKRHLIELSCMLVSIILCRIIYQHVDCRDFGQNGLSYQIDEIPAAEIQTTLRHLLAINVNYT